MTNSPFEPPFGGVRGNIHTSSVARWKACGQLPIRDNGTFSLSLTVEMLHAHIGHSRPFSEGVGHFEGIF